MYILSFLFDGLRTILAGRRPVYDLLKGGIRVSLHSGNVE